MPPGTQNFLALMLIASAAIIGFQFWGLPGFLACGVGIWLLLWLLSEPWRR